MIPCLVLSKDRSCQLDLLLRSIQQNAPNLFDITVIFTYSNENFYRAYHKLYRDEHPKVKFELEAEGTCNEDFYHWLDYNTHPLTAFFTDDCIFYRKNEVNEQELVNLFDMQNLWTFTYRLGDNITIQDYTRGNVTDRPRLMVEKYNSLLWDYTSVKSDHSFGWPCGLDGYIWRTQDLRNLLEGEKLEHFTRLEGLMVRQFQKKKPRACMMASPFNSNVWVSQCNITHQMGHNTTREFNISLKELNDLFLEGYRIDLSQMDFNEYPKCTHGEKRFYYKKD